MLELDMKCLQEGIKSIHQTPNGVFEKKTKFTEKFYTNLEENFQQLFKRKHHPKSFVITNCRKSKKEHHYFFKISKEKLVYKEPNNGSGKTTEFTFKTREFLFNNQTRSISFLENFIKQIKKIGRDVVSGDASVMEEE